MLEVPRPPNAFGDLFPVMGPSHQLGASEAERRKRMHLLRRTGPDGRTHRERMVSPEALAESVVIQKFSQADAGVFLVEQSLRLTKKPENFREHAPESGPEKIASLREEPVQRTP